MAYCNMSHVPRLVCVLCTRVIPAKFSSCDMDEVKARRPMLTVWRCYAIDGTGGIMSSTCPSVVSMYVCA